MQIRIYLEDVKTAVKRQLSIIGKHHATQRGDTLFSAATLSSVEEHVFQQFIIDGAQLVIAHLSPVLTAYTVGDLPDEPSAASGQSVANQTAGPNDAPSVIAPYLCFSVAASRTNQALSDAAQDSVCSLLVAYVVQAVLSMVLPDLAPKYAADVQSLLLAATRLVLAKSPPPKSPSTLTDFSGSVIF